MQQLHGQATGQRGHKTEAARRRGRKTEAARRRGRKTEVASRRNRKTARPQDGEAARPRQQDRGRKPAKPQDGEAARRRGLHVSSIRESRAGGREEPQDDGSTGVQRAVPTAGLCQGGRRASAPAVPPGRNAAFGTSTLVCVSEGRPGGWEGGLETRAGWFPATRGGAVPACKSCRAVSEAGPEIARTAR